MFYGQIMIQNYLKDPGISFCAVGDYTSDEAPLQITEFGQGKEIDQLIAKIYLEGGGGGGYTESYETAAYFYSEYIEMPMAEMSFFFITGDEAFYDEIPSEVIMKITGRDIGRFPINSKQAWADLMKKYNVFFIKKPYHNEKNDVKIKKLWVETIGEERVLEIVTPKACIDVILGAIALTSGTRNLEGYIKDMEDRGQDQGRILEVTKALKLYSDKLSNYSVIPVKPSHFSSSSNFSASSNLVYSSQINTKPINIISNQIEYNRENVSNVREVVQKIEGTENLNLENKKYLEALREMKKMFNNNIPPELLCPITEEIFFDPVMTCDGQTYERKAIEYWLQNHDTSPVTNLKLQSKNLIPNFVVKKIVREYFDKNNGGFK
jgi:hypothetical protein